MTDLSGVKAGDRLFVKRNNYDRGEISEVLRVTPTGRVITKFGEFNPTGRQRGGDGWSRGWARVATPDDIAGVDRQHLVTKLQSFPWGKLNAEDLKKIAAIVAGKDAP